MCLTTPRSYFVRFPSPSANVEGKPGRTSLCWPFNLSLSSPSMVLNRSIFFHWMTASVAVHSFEVRYYRLIDFLYSLFLPRFSKSRQKNKKKVKTESRPKNFSSDFDFIACQLSYSPSFLRSLSKFPFIQLSHTLPQHPPFKHPNDRNESECVMMIMMMTMIGRGRGHSDMDVMSINSCGMIYSALDSMTAAMLYLSFYSLVH